MDDRIASVKRTTKETDIAVRLNLDGSGKTDIKTGIGYFDHMLESFAKHGLFDLSVTAKGDLDVDCHHTVEDVGIALGKALEEALGDRKGIKRYGSFLLPMDEALALCAIDLSGRPFLSYKADFTVERLGGMDTETVRDFFYAVSHNALMCLHLKLEDGINNHHMAEALFKSFGRALDVAASRESRIDDVWSTKGSLIL